MADDRTPEKIHSDLADAAERYLTAVDMGMRDKYGEELERSETGLREAIAASRATLGTSGRAAG